ncbi:MAG TPA: DUF2244 domain-containing protein [Stellaceae bacterium]|nr:DUF2244 domain-containing protein [Stellaceae bacterium]
MTEPVPETQPEPPVLFEASLRPHRSLPPAGFFGFMLLVAVVSFCAGVGFVLMGAWPVTGFFGLDVLLLYGAFRLNYRSGRMRETLRLTGDSLTIERISVRGERRFWTFQPFWLRVQLIDTGADGNRLVLTSHGRSLAVAGFLSADERRVLAGDLQAALARYKAQLTQV